MIWAESRIASIAAALLLFFPMITFVIFPPFSSAFLLDFLPLEGIGDKNVGVDAGGSGQEIAKAYAKEIVCLDLLNLISITF